MHKPLNFKTLSIIFRQVLKLLRAIASTYKPCLRALAILQRMRTLWPGWIGKLKDKKRPSSAPVTYNASVPTTSAAPMTISTTSEGAGLTQAANPNPQPPKSTQLLSSPHGSEQNEARDDTAAPSSTSDDLYVQRSPLTNEYSTLPDRCSSPPATDHHFLPITSAQLLPRREPIGSHNTPWTKTQPYASDSLSSKNASSGVIPALTMSFEFDYLPAGWTCSVHPQGPIYFWNEEWRTITNANLYDPEILHCLNLAIYDIYHKVYQLTSADFRLPADVQLVLDVKEDEGGFSLGYYFATFQGRCLFWLSDKKVAPLFKRVKDVRSHSHIRYLMESEYWYHYQLFPNVQRVSSELVKELKSLLLYTAMDQTVNMMSTAEHSYEEVNRCISLIDNIEKDSATASGFHSPTNPQNHVGYSVWTVGTLMGIFALHKFDNYHGQKNARCYRDDLLYITPERKTRMLQILSPLLFYSPNTYLHSLQAIIVGDTVFTEAWRDFVQELHAEWNGLIIIATVILATNVAFLAIPSVDNGSDPETRSPEQIISYISTIWSASSILLGQLLARYHRIKGWEKLDGRVEAHFDFLPGLGPHVLAVMYSLPYALLSWGMIAFWAAFLVMCFRITSDVARIVVGIATIVVASYVVWCVLRAQGTDEDRQRRKEFFDRMIGAGRRFVIRKRKDGAGLSTEGRSSLNV